MTIKKYISNSGTTMEVGDFFGGGEDESIYFIAEEGNKQVRVTTNQGYYNLTLQPGDLLLYVDGTSKTIKSKDK